MNQPDIAGVRDDMNLKMISASDQRKLRGGRLLPLERAYKKVGRNEICPCGSGLKFKNCHLKKGWRN